MSADRSIKITPLSEEPWIKLANGNDLQSWQKEDEIEYNQKNRQSEKYSFFVKIFDFLNENQIEGDYHEYGCHRARTFRMALTEARRHSLDSMNFFAFDSFEGLPAISSAPSISKWEKGALKTGIEQFENLIHSHGIYVEKIKTIKGYYSESLTDNLQSELLQSGRKVALATVDCDLYESATPVFNFLEPFLQPGSVIYIDDYFCGYRGSPKEGVALAFHEFEERSHLNFEPHLTIGWWGRSYIAYG